MLSKNEENKKGESRSISVCRLIKNELEATISLNQFWLFSSKQNARLLSLVNLTFGSNRRRALSVPVTKYWAPKSMGLSCRSWRATQIVFVAPFWWQMNHLSLYYVVELKFCHRSEWATYQFAIYAGCIVSMQEEWSLLPCKLTYSKFL